MNPELKIYLEGMESRLASKGDLDDLAKITAKVIDTMEQNHEEVMAAHMQRINGIENRLDRTDNRIRVIETKLA